MQKKKNRIIGCHGFISNSQYSEKLILNDTIWMVNWVADKGIPNPGMKLVFFPIKKLNYTRIGTIGCNKIAKNIYKKIGFKVGEMKHYYLINSKIRLFKLIKNKKVNNKMINRNITKKKIRILKRKLNLNIFGDDKEYLQKKYGKDENFYINRYTKHPYYKYNIYQITELRKIVGFFVIRICKYKGSKALRIVDFFGYDEALIGINFPLQKLLSKTKAEYIDFYEYGMKNSIMLKSGLNKNNFSNDIIIPNYFEPFVKKNINLSWAIKSKLNRFVPMFKGDCDQDRPSFFKKKKKIIINI